MTPRSRVLLIIAAIALSAVIGAVARAQIGPGGGGAGGSTPGFVYLALTKFGM